MKKQLAIIGIIALFVCVELSGCDQISNPLTSDKTLPGGTKVTGDTGQIQIVEHNISKNRRIGWTNAQEMWRVYYSGEANRYYEYDGHPILEVPWNFVIPDLNNLSNRREFYLQYIDSNESDWTRIQEYKIPYEPFTAFTTMIIDTTPDPYGMQFYDVNLYKISNVSLQNSAIWYVKGTAKNIGNIYLNYAQIIVNFYNANGAWLASETDSHQNVPSGYTWNFNVKYDGQFANDVSYVSFEVKANL